MATHTTCATCSARVKSAKAYFSEGGDPLCDHCFEDDRNVRRSAHEHSETSARQKVGVFMMLAGVAWFFAALSQGYVFFFPPFLLIAGFLTYRGGYRLA